MYIKPSNLGRLEELEGLVQTADFYDALPIISRFVEASLQNSEDLISPVSRFMSNAVKTLCLALKLKATALFRQSFIHVICLYHQDITDDLTSQCNEDLISLVNLYYARLYRDTADANFFLMKACLNHEYVLHWKYVSVGEKEVAVKSEIVENELHPYPAINANISTSQGETLVSHIFDEGSLPS